MDACILRAPYDAGVARMSRALWRWVMKGGSSTYSLLPRLRRHLQLLDLPSYGVGKAVPRCAFLLSQEMTASAAASNFYTEEFIA